MTSRDIVGINWKVLYRLGDILDVGDNMTKLSEEETIDIYDDVPFWTERHKAQAILSLNGIIFGAMMMIAYIGTVTEQLVIGWNTVFIIGSLLQAIITIALGININRYFTAGDFE